MLDSGSDGLAHWLKNYNQSQPLTMEEVIALRHKIDPEFAPALAAELDDIIDAAQDNQR